MTEQKNQKTYSGFAALIGRPNSGKSTLMNAVIGEKISVVTPLPQTTRNCIHGIYTHQDTQIIFIDTPGMHQGKYRLNKTMLAGGMRTLNDEGIDIACYLVDLSRPFGDEEDSVCRNISAFDGNRIIVFNKVDLCENPESHIESFYSRYPSLKEWPSVVISALSPHAGKEFIHFITPFISEGPFYYPADDISDADLRFFTAESIRKEIITLSSQEVPHASAIEITDYTEQPNCHKVRATIHVETRGQRGIIIGNKGMQIKKIQQKASRTMYSMVGIPFRISCHVTITPKWRDNPQFLRRIGFDKNDIDAAGA